MTRQYIGARYVPRFTGLYDNTRQYEGLDVVDNGSGTTYIARKIVPPNTPLTNTDYWFVYGASSGAILDLQSRMDAAENDIDDNAAAILTKQNIKDKIIFIGDSYGVATGDATRSYPYLVGDNLGMTVNVDYWENCYGGASWKGLNGRKSFKTLLEELDAVITDKASITKIIVCGGVNDAVGTMSDIYSGAQAFITYARLHYPNARIYSGMIGWNVNSPTRRNIANISYAGYNNLGAFGIGVIDNAYMVMHDYRFFQSDGTHPTQAGQNAIAYMLASFIIGNNACVNGYGEISTNVTRSAKFSSGSWSIKETKSNSVITVSWPSVDLSFASGETIGYDTQFALGTKEPIYWLTDASNQHNSIIEMQARLVYNDGSYQSRPVMLNVINAAGTLMATPLFDHDFNNISNPIILTIQGGNKTFNPIMC